MLLVSTRCLHLSRRVLPKKSLFNHKLSSSTAGTTFHLKGPKILDVIKNSKANRRNSKSFGDDLSSTSQSTSTSSSSSSITWYSCGPTVYDQAHIGHARTYVCSDIIRRILEDYFNISVNYAMGITDIDDKIIQKGKELGYYEWYQIESLTRELELQFFIDMDKLNVKRPNAVLRVTEHIEDILQYIAHIEKLGYAYVIPHDGVYFDVKKLGNRYGTLCPIPPSNMTDNNDNSDDASPASMKRHWRDFALWKFTPTVQSSSSSSSSVIQTSPSDSDSSTTIGNNSNNNDNKVVVTEPSWPSQWGRGRPGWHIECSAMTHAYFGSTIDIHSGGVDLKFPHHTNEIAQSETHNGCCGSTDTSDGPSQQQKDQWVSAWLHTGHLYIQGRKMSKSLKNFISIKEYLSSTSSQEQSTQHQLISASSNTGDSNSSDLIDNIADNNSSGSNSSDEIKSNIISIITNNSNPYAAVDFRLFCLQHKYHTSVHFSSDRITDASQFRIKLQYLLNLYQTLMQQQQQKQPSQHSKSIDIENEKVDSNRTILANNSSNIHSNIPSKRTTPRSRHLQASLQSTQTTAHDAMCDDFDTPVVMRALSGLMSEATDYASDWIVQSVAATSLSMSSKNTSSDRNITDNAIADSKQHSSPSSLSSSAAAAAVGPLEPLIAVVEYISKICSVVGLEASVLNNSGSNNITLNARNGESGSSSIMAAIMAATNGGIMTTNNLHLIDLLVKFRANIRSQCLQSLKSSSKMKKKRPTAVTTTTTKTASDTTGAGEQIQQQQLEDEQQKNAALASVTTLQQLLKMCDKLRDEELLSLGIQVIEDGSSVSSSSGSSGGDSGTSSTAGSGRWKPVLPK